MSAMMQGMFAAQAQYADGPSEAVTHMNKALCRRGLESRFVTLMFGIIDGAGSLTYCNAGHNPPFVLGKSGIRRLEEGGPVVGLLEFAPYAQDIVRLDPGDVIVIFSDGVSEALDAGGEEFGDARLEAVATAARDETSAQLVDRIVVAVREFTKGAPQSDDITVMVIRYLGPAAA
jgi:sigma-B regulation protein RsbU (phosphoserine phosphatase)